MLVKFGSGSLAKAAIAGTLGEKIIDDSATHGTTNYSNTNTLDGCF